MLQRGCDRVKSGSKSIKSVPRGSNLVHGGGELGEIRVTKHKIGTVMVKIGVRRQKLGEIRVKNTGWVQSG